MSSSCSSCLICQAEALFLVAPLAHVLALENRIQRVAVRAADAHEAPDLGLHLLEAVDLLARGRRAIVADALVGGVQERRRGDACALIHDGCSQPRFWRPASVLPPWLRAWFRAGG